MQRPDRGQLRPEWALGHQVGVTERKVGPRNQRREHHLEATLDVRSLLGPQPAGSEDIRVWGAEEGEEGASAPSPTPALQARAVPCGSLCCGSSDFSQTKEVLRFGELLSQVLGSHGINLSWRQKGLGPALWHSG